MAHTTIKPADEDRYYAGDAIDIPFEFTDEHDSESIDLTGHTVEFRVKENSTDDDEEAIVTKSGTEGESPTDLTFTSPADGEVEVHIDTDDTTEAVTGPDGNRQESTDTFWHARVIDANENRVTAVTGNWEMYSS